MKILPAGTEFTCPKCGATMCRLNRDLMSGDIIKSSYVDAVVDKPKPHMPALCPFDQTPYGDSRGTDGGFRIHTREGWK